MSPHEVGSDVAKATSWKPQEFRLRHSSDEPSNDRGAKGVAKRGSVSEEIGTAHSGGQPG